MAFDFCMNMTDIIIAGILGKETQAAIGMANQAYYVFAVVTNAVSVGTIAVISRVYAGYERQKELPSAIFTAVVFAAATSFVVTILAVTFAPLVIARLDINPGVKAKTITFIYTYCIGLFFHLTVAHYNSILRACKMIKTAMKALTTASLLNIFLNITFVFYTPLGHIGIPLSTSVSWIVAFVALSVMIFRLMRGEKKFSKSVAKKIFGISWPMGIVSASWQLSSMTLFTIVGMLPSYSVEVMAAMTAGLRIESIIFMPAFAFNMANAVLVGSLLGEKKPDDAYTVGLVTAAAGVTTIILLTFIVIIFAEPIAALLGSKDAAGNVDPVVMREIIRYLHIVMLSEPFMATNLMFSGALNGAGDTRPLMRYSLFSLWIVRIPTAYILGIVFGFGATAIWWAMNVTFVCQSFLSGRRYLSKKWITGV
jgi:putative MATE family efflux protein